MLRQEIFNISCQYVCNKKFLSNHHKFVLFPVELPRQNSSIEITGNQFQQNISLRVTGSFLDTFLTGDFIKFPVNFTELFYSE